MILFNRMKEGVTIVGFGWVGQANAIALSLDGYEVSVFDPQTPPAYYPEHNEIYPRLRHLKHPLEDDSQNRIYLVCVGDSVDESGRQDISNIRKALDSLKETRGMVVLRSTILPTHLESLDFDLYVPEFLHEKAAVEECLHPHFLVVGKKKATTPIPSFIGMWRTRSTKYIECTPGQASHIKYLSNLWNALRIGFINEFGSSVAEPASDEALGTIQTVIDFIFDNKAYGRYGKSFDGHCLPKDTRAYAAWVRTQGSQAPILEGLMSSNNLHRERELKYSTLKKWFSNWKA